MTTRATHAAPVDCPVCGTGLVHTRLSCDGCGTELSGRFSSCPYCRLDDDAHALLRAFLVSRGNTKEIQRRLGVSYPTARARVTALLAALGLDDEAAPDDEPDAAAGDDSARLQVLERLARGEVDVDAALEELG